MRSSDSCCLLAEPNDWNPKGSELGGSGLMCSGAVTELRSFFVSPTWIRTGGFQGGIFWLGQNVGPDGATVSSVVVVVVCVVIACR